MCHMLAWFNYQSLLSSCRYVIVDNGGDDGALISHFVSRWRPPVRTTQIIALVCVACDEWQMQWWCSLWCDPYLRPIHYGSAVCVSLCLSVCPSVGRRRSANHCSVMRDATRLAAWWRHCKSLIYSWRLASCIATFIFPAAPILPLNAAGRYRPPCLSAPLSLSNKTCRTKALPVKSLPDRSPPGEGQKPAAGIRRAPSDDEK